MKKLCLKSVASIILCFFAKAGFCGISCLDHPWYKQAPVETHWSLIDHKINNSSFQVITDVSQRGTAGWILESVSAAPISVEEAKQTFVTVPEVLAGESLFLIRGIRYPTPNGAIEVYSLKGAAMVGFSFLGPVRLDSALDAPVLVALPSMPTVVYVGCSGAS